MEAVQGRKTYGVALLTLVFAVVGFVLGFVEVDRLGELLAIAGGLAGIRHAISTEGSTVVAQLLAYVVGNSDFVQQLKQALKEEEAKQNQRPQLNLFTPDPTP